MNNDREKLNKDLDTMLIFLAEAYVDRCKMPKIPDVLREVGVTYEKNKVYGAHIQAVQRLLIDEFKIMGFDLVKEVEKHNEKFEIGKISKYEKDILINKIENLACYTNKIAEYKAGK